MDFRPGQLLDERIEKILRESAANMHLEGIGPTDDEISMGRRYLCGEITEKEFFDWIYSCDFIHTA